MVKYLVKNRADVTAQDNDAVCLASKNGHLDVVKYLVSVGADVTAQDNDAVCLASENGHLDVVKYLVNVGADITDHINCPVRWASENGHLNIIEYLLSIGADINQILLEHKIFFRQKRAYSKWRRIYLRNWVRKVMIPLYYSPQNRGGIQAKKDLQVVVCRRHPAPRDTQYKKELEECLV